MHVFKRLNDKYRLHV